jgi:hypothetical protein
MYQMPLGESEGSKRKEAPNEGSHPGDVGMPCARRGDAHPSTGESPGDPDKTAPLQRREAADAPNSSQERSRHGDNAARE